MQLTPEVNTGHVNTSRLGEIISELIKGLM